MGEILIFFHKFLDYHSLTQKLDLSGANTRRRCNIPKIKLDFFKKVCYNNYRKRENRKEFLKL